MSKSKKIRRESIRKSRGRPTKFNPELCQPVYQLALLRHTDEEIAEFLRVNPKTFKGWKSRHPDLILALSRGRKLVEGEVVAKMVDRALGYSHPAVKILVCDKAIEEVPYTEHYPPDGPTGMKLLAKWRPEVFGDKVTLEVGATLEELVAESMNFKAVPRESPAVPEAARKRVNPKKEKGDAG